MTRFLPDSSCIVAAVCDWHEHREQARREIDRRLDSGETLVLAAPALAETYAVLTRLPPPNRVSPAHALRLLDENFIRRSEEIVALEPETIVQLLRRSAELGTQGGAIYDAVILACASTAGAAALLTFNRRHFESHRVQGVEIVEPI